MRLELRITCALFISRYFGGGGSMTMYIGSGHSSGAVVIGELWIHLSHIIATNYKKIKLMNHCESLKAGDRYIHIYKCVNNIQIYNFFLC